MIGTNKKNNAPQPDPIRRHPPNVLPRSVRKEPRMAITAAPLHKNMKNLYDEAGLQTNRHELRSIEVLLQFRTRARSQTRPEQPTRLRRAMHRMDQRPDMSQTLRSGHQGDAALHATLSEGESSIPERQEILAEKREHLETQLEELRKAIAYIDEKQRFYADVTAGRTAYCSNVIDTTQSD